MICPDCGKEYPYPTEFAKSEFIKEGGNLRCTQCCIRIQHPPEEDDMPTLPSYHVSPTNRKSRPSH
jgi:hypothetical protein